MRRRSKPRRAPSAPFSPDEDAKLKDMMSCGLAVDFYRLGCPDRSLGELLDRRLVLRETGQARLAPLI